VNYGIVCSREWNLFRFITSNVEKYQKEWLAMKKTMMIMLLAGVVSLLTLTGCATFLGQAQINVRMEVPNPVDLVPEQTQESNPTTLPSSTDSIQTHYDVFAYDASTYDNFSEDNPPRDVPTMAEPSYITIRGEQFSTDLTELILDNVPIDEIIDWDNALRDEDIVPLRYMTNLTRLSIWAHQISDITPLAELTSLESLNLDRNQISDITPLAGLINLEVLSLSHNLIRDITPLAELTNLTFLRLLNNQISNISPLAGLINVNHLELCDNLINNVAALSGLTNLRTLTLINNQIPNTSPLSQLPYLDSLSLYRDQNGE
jgi:Leucine-rich repeat (LRR) protein